MFPGTRVICLLGVITLLGCGPSTEFKEASKLAPAPAKEHDHALHEGAHHHYGAGPHGGSVVELGEDDFHAEFVFDHEGHAIHVFLLKSDAKSPRPSKAKEATLNLSQATTVSLKASPLDGESDGFSSHFEVVDEDLVHDLLEQGYLHGDLTVQIDDRPFKTHLDLHFDNTVHEHTK